MFMCMVGVTELGTKQLCDFGTQIFSSECLNTHTATYVSDIFMCGMIIKIKGKTHLKLHQCMHATTNNLTLCKLH